MEEAGVLFQTENFSQEKNKLLRQNKALCPTAPTVVVIAAEATTTATTTAAAAAATAATTTITTTRKFALFKVVA